MKILATLMVLLSAHASASPFGGWPDATGKLAPWKKAAPAFVAGPVWKQEGGAAVAINVQPGRSIAPITPYHLGNNLSWWMGRDWALDADRIAKAREAGIRFWRGMGGSSSDNYCWDNVYGPYKNAEDGEFRPRMNRPQDATTDDFIEICRQTQAEGILTANYGMARWGTLSDALLLAQSWVLHTNVEKQFKVRHWEIGNEVYGNWESGYKVKGKPDLSGDQYGRDFREYVKAMKAIDKDIYVGAVAVNEDNGEEWTGYKWWMKGMLPEAAPVADYLIWHEYFIWPFEGADKKVKVISNEEIFAKSASIGESVKKINAMVAKYGKRKAPLPIALTEYNILNGNMPQTLQQINALFTAEVVGEAVKHGIVAANIWDWKNGYDSAYGGGDHAMLSDGEPGLPNATPRPTFYAFALMSRVFGDHMVESESGDSQVRAYATGYDGGGLGLVISNEKSAAVALELDLGGFEPKGQASLYTVTAEGLNSKKVAFNGVYGEAPAGGPFPIASIPPYTVELKAGKTLKVSIPATSLVGLVLR